MVQLFTCMKRRKKQTSKSKGTQGIESADRKPLPTKVNCYNYTLPPTVEDIPPEVAIPSGTEELPTFTTDFTTGKMSRDSFEYVYPEEETQTPSDSENAQLEDIYSIKKALSQKLGEEKAARAVKAMLEIQARYNEGNRFSEDDSDNQVDWKYDPVKKLINE